jgi:hypothetical protein
MNDGASVLQLTIKISVIARRLALFMAILLSGGAIFLSRPILSVLFVMFCFLAKGPTFGFRREMLPIGLLLAAIAAASLAGGGLHDVPALVTRWTNFIFGVMLLALYISESRAALLGDLKLILSMMAVQALITAVVGTLAPGLFAQVSLGTGEDTTNTILYIFNYHAELVEGVSFIVRPDGFFFEPGVFQMYLNIYLLIAAFVYRDVRHVALAVFAQLTLQSTTGMIILTVIGLLFAARYVQTASSVQRALALIIAPMMILPLVLIAQENTREKFTGTLQGSSWARQFDLYTGLAVANANPVVGIGFSYDDYYREAMRYGYRETLLDENSIQNRGNSNGLATVLYSVGYPVGLLLILALVLQTVFVDRWKMAFLMILSLNAEALFFTPFVLMLVYSAVLIRRRAGVSALQPPRLSYA